MNENGTDYKKKCEEYESILGVGERDIAKDAFISLCRVVSAQSKRIGKFNLDTEIETNSKEDKVYDRTMAIVEKMPKMISEINSLRKELGLTNKLVSDEVFADSIAKERK